MGQITIKGAKEAQYTSIATDINNKFKDGSIKAIAYPDKIMIKGDEVFDDSRGEIVRAILSNPLKIKRDMIIYINHSTSKKIKPVEIRGLKPRY